MLELAIGTGRIALPLAARGVDITGIDISAEMVAGLRAKPGGDRIPVIMGDFADVAVNGTFRLVYLVLNTLFGPWTKMGRVRCFADVAAHLKPGGRFVIEAFVPDIARFDRDQRISTNSIRPGGVAFEYRSIIRTSSGLTRRQSKSPTRGSFCSRWRFGMPGLRRWT